MTTLNEGSHITELVLVVSALIKNNELHLYVLPISDLSMWYIRYSCTFKNCNEHLL